MRITLLISILLVFTFTYSDLHAQSSEEIKVGYKIGDKAPDIVISNTKDTLLAR